MPIPEGVDPEHFLREQLMRLELSLQEAQMSAARAGGNLLTPARTAPIAVFDTPTEFKAVIELAGVKPRDVSVQLVQGAFVIVANAPLPGTEGESHPPVYSELGPRRFERVITAPPYAKVESAEVRLEGGILTIRCPKEAGTHKQLKVEAA
jgi:HSP20 family molecular chaperone IbpA